MNNFQIQKHIELSALEVCEGMLKSIVCNNPRDKEILKLRMLGDEKNARISLEYIGTKLCTPPVTRERVRQVESREIKKVTSLTRKLLRNQASSNDSELLDKFNNISILFNRERANVSNCQTHDNLISTFMEMNLKVNVTSPILYELFVIMCIGKESLNEKSNINRAYLKKIISEIKTETEWRAEIEASAVAEAKKERESKNRFTKRAIKIFNATRWPLIKNGVDFTTIRRKREHDIKKDIYNIISKKMNKVVSCDSGLEAKYFYLLEQYDDVVAFCEQPIIIEYDNPSEKKRARYYPDAMVKLANGSIIIVEVKPKWTKNGGREWENPVNLAKWQEAEKFCQKMGYGWLVTDVRTAKIDLIPS
ncbi:MAG: TnsA endonuclease N-terminal domain-containing protein [Bacillota bacterium]